MAYADAERIALARHTIANALADIPASEPVDAYDHGYRDGQCAAYVHALALLEVGE